jgi:uncharacterized protein (TIGR03000 family)
MAHTNEVDAMRCNRRWGVLAVFGLVALFAAPASVAQPAKKKDNSATLVVRVHKARASLTIDGTKTTRKGLTRRFTTPPLVPGKEYTYKLVMTWKDNVYTQRTRERVVTVEAGKTTTADLRKEDPKNPDKIVVVFEPTPRPVVEAMCKLAGVNKNDVVYDLGCGDGIILITAVKKFGAKKGVGIDIDPERVQDTKRNARRAGVADRIEVRQGDILKVKDLSRADVVMLYVGTDLNRHLQPILQKTLKPGSRVVSHHFLMGDDWPPHKTAVVRARAEDGENDEHNIYLWVIGKKKDEGKK